MLRMLLYSIKITLMGFYFFVCNKIIWFIYVNVLRMVGCNIVLLGFIFYEVNCLLIDGKMNLMCIFLIGFLLCFNILIIGCIIE